MQIGDKVRVEYSSFKGDVYREVKNDYSMTGTVTDITDSVFTVLGFHSKWDKSWGGVPTKEAFMLSDVEVKLIKVVQM